MGQSQEKLSERQGAFKSNNVRSREKSNNSTSTSCLKSPDHAYKSGKHRVTFEKRGSFTDDEFHGVATSLTQSTLNIHPRERLLDYNGPSTINRLNLAPTAANHPSINLARGKSSSIGAESETCRRSLRLALSNRDDDLRRACEFTKTNGFHEELVELSVDEDPVIPLSNIHRTVTQVHARPSRKIAGSYSRNSSSQDEDKRCPSDHSFWSSDYSTSAGGNSERSNDSSDLGNLSPNAYLDLNLLPSRTQNYEAFSQRGSKKNERRRSRSESLQERLRQRLTNFQNEQSVFNPGRHTIPVGIHCLPEYILLHIFSYLPTKYLCVASGVCRRWRVLCWDPQLWRSLKLSRYPGSNFDRVLYNILSRLARSTQGLCLTLQYVRIVQCEYLSDRGLGYIAKYCIDLKKLEILACPCVTSRGIQSILESCLSLTWVDVRGCTCVSSVCYSIITNIQSRNDTCFPLTFLDVSDCVAVDDLGLRILSFACKHLETLHMRRCPRVTDVGMQHIANHCKSLRELSISDCHKVRDFSLKEIARRCPALRYLSLMRCSVTDTGIKLIAKGCNNIRYLNVRGCVGVTDVGVVYVAQNCLKLRSLDVGKCDITNNTLSALGIHCPQLKRLSIKGCFNLTDVGIRAVVAQCCLLHYLNVEDCSITLDTYEFIREHCQSCVIEHTSLDI